MIKIETFSDLLNNSIPFKSVIYDDCQVDKGYYHNFGILGFIYKGDKYIIPHTKCIVDILLAEGFSLFDMYLPQSTDLRYSLNKNQKILWKQLKTWCEEQRKNDYTNQCAEYCKVHGYKEISKTELDKCTLIPKEGFFVFAQSTKRWRKKIPVTATEYFIREIAVSLGKFNTSPYGWLAFIYSDGNMYLTKELSVLEALTKAGYTRSLCVYVPNSEIKIK